MTLNPGSQSGAPGQQLNYTVTVTNNDSAACAASRFDTGSMVPPGWTGTFNPTSLTLSPGASNTETFSLTSSASAAPNSYGFSVQANRPPPYNGHVDGTYVVTSGSTSGSGSGSGSTASSTSGSGSGSTSSSGSGSGSTSGGCTTTSTSSGSTSSGSTGGVCSSSADCGGSTIACNTSSSTCVQCLIDADCPSGEACATASVTCSTNNPCPYGANTAPTLVQNSAGCRILDRDTSACEASRTAQGLSGAWLKFSCRLTLTKTTVGNQAYVKITSDGLPDYHSNYFASNNACHEAYTPSFPDPGINAAQSMVMMVPYAPTGTNGMAPAQPSGGGLAINGVNIFGDEAAPGDDIYQEKYSFDRCGGHPQNTGMYHYHAEPYTISQDDDALVGVELDGYFVYGRKDPDGSAPGELGGAADTYPYYGHVGYTVDSPCVQVFHYHVHYEANDAGESAYFIEPGHYYGTVVGSCTNGDAGC